MTDSVKKLNSWRIVCSKQKFPTTPDITKIIGAFFATKRDFIAVTTVFVALEVRFHSI